MQIGRGRPWGTAHTVYEEIGGAETVRCVADTFYDSKPPDEALGPLEA